MAHLSRTISLIETPMERIFEKVMLRKMTEKEKDILDLNVPLKPAREHSTVRLRLPGKNRSNLREEKSGKLTSL